MRRMTYISPRYYARSGVRAAWAAGSNAHPATYFPATTSPSVAKGVGVVPDLSLRVLAIDGQLFVRTCHRSDVGESLAGRILHDIAARNWLSRVTVGGGAPAARKTTGAGP